MYYDRLSLWALPMNKVHFNIIIPTRDRADTLRYSLASAINQDYPHFNVLVCDNASTDDTAHVVAQFKDDRLRYIRAPKRLSMSENWEFALSYVSTGWVTILGDDDALLPGSLEFVNQIIQETGTKAVRSNGCNYVWPLQHDQASSGWLQVTRQKGYRLIKSREILSQVLSGVKDYTELPVLYTGGFTSIDILNMAKDVVGYFYRSRTPDVYSGIVLSLLIDDYIYSYKPLAVNGSSKHSNGASQLYSRSASGSESPYQKYLSEDNLPFHPFLCGPTDLPLIRSRQILVYEAYLQARPYLHNEEYTTFKHQLELLHADLGPDPESSLLWAHYMATNHQIHINWQFVIYYYIRRRAIQIINRLLRYSSVTRLKGCHQTPLSNVYEASILAAALLSS